MITNVSGFNGPDMTALYQDLFKKLDSNSDGGVDKTEFQTAVSTRANGQTIASDEIDAMFTKLDTSGDGKVDDTEMMAALKEAGEQRRAMMPPPPPMGGPAGQNEELTDEEKSTVVSILAGYDASNLTEEDAKAINQAFRDAGISFGKSLGDAVEEAGFSVQTLMELDPPQQSKNEGNGANALFSDLIDYLSANQQTDDDQLTALFKSLINNIQNGSAYNQSGVLNSGSSTYESLLSVFA
jgi:Ca2+-binding EF-hand superfamily protein